MKKYLVSFAVITLFFLGVQDLIAQTLLPDSATSLYQKFKDPDIEYELLWYPNGTTYCTYNGDLYMFVWTEEHITNSILTKRYYTKVWKLVNKEFQPFTVDGTNNLVFGYPFEDDWDIYYDKTREYDLVLIGRPFAFVYHGRLWYYAMIQNPNRKDSWCQLWAQLTPDGTHWIRSFNFVDWELPNYNRLAATEVGDKLQIFNWQTETKNIFVEEYGYNENTQSLYHISTYGIPVPGSDIGAVLSYKDGNRNNCYIVNSSIPYAMEYLTFYSPVTGWHSEQLLNPAPVASTITQGSIKGSRPGEDIHPEEGNRFTVFTIGGVETSDKCYKMYADEWLIPVDTATRPQKVRTSEVVLPASWPLQTVKGLFGVGSAQSTFPWDFVTDVEGIDGLKQNVWVFYPDKKANMYGVGFISDNWSPVKKSGISSSDLGNDDPVTGYTSSIRSLWTLVGLVDGAPPCSIDWGVWTTLHTPEVEPADLNFQVETVSKSEVSSTYEDAYSLGGKIETLEEEVMTIDNSFKYTNTFENKVASGSSVKSSLTTRFGLNESSQESGSFIWAVPKIHRITYQLYPWWDAQFQHPVPNSLQYQFRTEGMLTMVKEVDISSFPFLIDEPNAPDLSDWKYQHRSAMYNDIEEYDLQPVVQLSWTNFVPGPVYSLVETATTTSSVTSKSSWQQEFTMGAKLPEVFKISGSIGSDVSYSTETTYETEFGTELEISMSNMIEMSNGINISYYDYEVYWFKPNEGAWWYLDSLDGEKPWYISYLVGTVNTAIRQLSPGEQCTLGSSGLMFTWQADGGELTDYKFFIATDPHISPSTTLYKLHCGEVTAASPKEFIPKPGTTYYWSVRGKAPNGELVWSGSRAFTFREADPGEMMPSIPVDLYPNPAGNGEVFVTFELDEPGPVTITILDINGRMLQQLGPVGKSAGIITEMILLTAYEPGVYIVVVQTNSASTVKKLIVGN